jgi:class 3 adenylate cyclase/tetratricopeptide (TPR) repeat protein
MSSLEEQISHLQAAIAAQEALRPTLGDAVVEAALTALRAQLEALRALQRAAEHPQTGLPPEQLLARLQSYLPKELAEKMRATGRIEGERRQVTVLFADLTGFTALSERLDPEVVAAVANDVLKQLAEAVYQYEGYIDMFAGDAVMAVFGAPVAHEDDPERALRAALAMREQLEQLNRRWIDRLGDPLAVHIGINTGPVVAGSVGTDLRLAYTVMGDTVNTASRLGDAARPGQILVSRDTHRLVHEAFTFLALEPLTLKGKRGPLTVFELQHARLQPGKSRGLKDLASAFVARRREMAQLRDVMQELAAGRGRIVTLTGEAGIGKSRLMAEWRAEIGDRARWLEGRAFALTTALAYGPFLDLVRRYAGITDDDSEAQARARLRAAVAALFPDSLEAPALLSHLLAMRLSPDEENLLSSLPAESLRGRLFAHIEEMLVRLTEERPVWLVLEDLHWADLTSLALLKHLLPLTEYRPLAIVSVFRRRSDEIPRQLYDVAQARYADGFTEISLAPLSDAASVALVERLLSTPSLPDTLKALILDKAEGNPFFVEEVVRSLIERGALARSECGEGWIATPVMESVTVPDTVQGVLMARLDRLPEATKWVAQQAAVIGRVFLYRVLRQMSVNAPGIDADLSHLEREELIRERVRRPEVEYIFKHALTQEVAYQSLLVPRRKELHRRVGEAMEVLFAERLPEFYGILANHFARGEAWEKAADYLIQAGDAAARLYAYAEARQHYLGALEALARLPDTDETRRRRVDTTTQFASVALAGDPERNLALLTAAEPLAQALPGPDGTPGGDRLRLARVWVWTARSHFYHKSFREALSYSRRAMPVAQASGDEALAVLASTILARVMFWQGQFGEAAPLFARAAAPLEAAAHWTEWTLNGALLGCALAAQGQYAAGLDEVRRGLTRAGAMNNPSGVILARVFLSISHLMGRDLQCALEESRAAAQLAEQSGESLWIYSSCGYRAWAESRLGNHGAAVQSMVRSQAVREGYGVRLFMDDWFAAANAEIALNAGRLEDALALAKETIAAAEAEENLFAQGLAHRVWGVALAALDPGRAEETESQMRASLHCLETGEARLEAAWTHLAWARLCCDRGDRTAANVHREAATHQLAASGLTEALTRIREGSEE